MALTESPRRSGGPPCGSSGVDGPIVWLRGEHDLSTVDTLALTLARRIAVDDSDLMVELGGVQFMGAATAGVLIRCHTFLRLRSRSLILRSPSPRVRRVLELCGLADLLEAGPTEEVPPSGSGGALGTWVKVPAADRSDRRAPEAGTRPSRTRDPVRVRTTASTGLEEA